VKGGEGCASLGAIGNRHKACPHIVQQIRCRREETSRSAPERATLHVTGQGTFEVAAWVGVEQALVPAGALGGGRPTSLTSKQYSPDHPF